MQATVTLRQRQAAKREIVRQMKQGASTHEARVRSDVPMHRTTVYRLRVSGAKRRRVCPGREATRTPGQAERGGSHLADGLLPEPSFGLQFGIATPLSERFGFSVSVSQLHRVRAAHGLSRMPVPQEKN